MTLYVLAHEKIRKDDNLNFKVLAKVLTRDKLKISTLNVPEYFLDELKYKLRRVNRC